MQDREYKKSREFFRLHAELCQAISHAKRLEILSLLRDGEMTVSTLAERMELSPANVSQQLGVLRRAGVVDRRRDGTSCLYRLSDSRILAAYDLMTEVLTERQQRRLDALSDEATRAGASEGEL